MTERRNVLVTGASSGLGEALSRTMVNRGCRVWGVARREDLLKKLQEDLPPGRFLYSVCDVAAVDEVEAALHSMEAHGFRPEVVILNAGVNAHDLEPEFNLAECERVFRVNVFGALIWVDRLLPRFLREGRGHFVAISSMSAFLVSARGSSYAASKAALSMAFESLRRRYHGSPIRFTTVHLGPVDTAMWPGGRFPLLLSPEDASARIISAIERGKSVYDCPASAVLLARLAALMPRRLFLMAERLVKGNVRTQTRAPKE